MVIKILENIEKLKETQLEFRQKTSKRYAYFRLRKYRYNDEITRIKAVLDAMDALKDIK